VQEADLNQPFAALLLGPETDGAQRDAQTPANDTTTVDGRTRPSAVLTTVGDGLGHTKTLGQGS
jgi:hypothetical protein